MSIGIISQLLEKESLTLTHFKQQQTGQDRTGTHVSWGKVLGLIYVTVHSSSSKSGLCCSLCSLTAYRLVNNHICCAGLIGTCHCCASNVIVSYGYNYLIKVSSVSHARKKKLLNLEENLKGCLAGLLVTHHGSHAIKVLL